MGLASMLVPAASANASPPNTMVDLAFVGDMPYATDFNSTTMANWATDLNGSGIQFVAHSGDFKGGSDTCSDTRMTTTLGYYNGLNVPFWATPGDNDWTDCHRNNNGDSNSLGYDPLERLTKVRSLYFPNAHQTNAGGGTPITVSSQGDSTATAEEPYVENTYFSKDCVTFGDVHSVSSANGLLTPTQGSLIKSSSSNYINAHVTANDYNPLQTARNAEVAARTAANIAWVDKIFDAAQADPNNEAVFLMMQAEPALYGDQPAATGNYALSTTDPYGNTETPIYGNDQVSHYDEFWDLRAKIYARAKAYGKPVIIAHGDQHTYTLTPNYLTMNQSKKGADPNTGASIATGLPDLPALSNVTRLENFGSNGATTSGSKNWIEVRATCGTDYVFAQRPRVVGTAPGSFVNFPANGPPANVPDSRYPILLGLSALIVVGGAVLTVRRRAVR
jgi:hypothetical protein